MPEFVLMKVGLFVFSTLLIGGMMAIMLSLA